jgi:hypothetical protein
VINREGSVRRCRGTIPAALHARPKSDRADFFKYKSERLLFWGKNWATTLHRKIQSQSCLNARRHAGMLNARPQCTLVAFVSVLAELIAFFQIAFRLGVGGLQLGGTGEFREVKVF